MCSYTTSTQHDGIAERVFSDTAKCSFRHHEIDEFKNTSSICADNPSVSDTIETRTLYMSPVSSLSLCILND